MIQSVTLLKDECKVCGARADFRVVQTHPDSQQSWMKGSSYATSYCKAHLPPDATQFWRSQS